jgi:hypothetical protein
MGDDRPVTDPLRFDHGNDCTIRRAEDATRVNDDDHGDPGWTFTRPITPTELTLLTSLGYTDSDGQPPTPEARTVIGYHSPGVRLRDWPDLTQEATP